MSFSFSRIPRLVRRASVGTLLAAGATTMVVAIANPTARAHDRDDRDHADKSHGKGKGPGHDNHDGRDNHGPDRYSIALWGDMPYNALGKAQYPALLEDVNNADIAFSIFDGDLKSGGDGACTDENLYTPALGYFNSLRQPMVWVPGDNDWTDCWGRYGAASTAPGADDPIERLQHERDLFASTPYSLGQRKLRLTRQSSQGGKYAQYSENIRWKVGPVVYIGLNVQGSNDNYPYAGVDGETRTDEQIAVQRAESLARREANLAWLADGFAYAKHVGAVGVMVVFQADLNWNNEQHLTDTRSYDAFPPYIAALRDATVAFGGPVALVHGDSHYFKLDMPMNGEAGGVVPNFVRVETFGARNTHWVKCTVDVSNPSLFSFEPVIVPANAD